MSAKSITFCFLLVCLTLFVYTKAVTIQEIKFYTPSAESYSAKDEIIFRSSLNDLTNYQFFLNKTTSVCATGFWQIFSKPNFEGLYTSYGFSEKQTCLPILSNQSKMSIRRMGNTDLSEVSLTFYSDIYGQGKEEYLKESSPNVTIINPKSIFFTGIKKGKVWEFFSEPNYSGEATVISFGWDTYAEVHCISTFDSIIKSVRIG
jgi:hypothetical protein